VYPTLAEKANQNTARSPWIFLVFSEPLISMVLNDESAKRRLTPKSITQFFAF
jgi:hypothetical protein